MKSDEYERLETFETEERFARRKTRRKPHGRRSVRELEEHDPQRDPTTRFADPGLQELHERNHLTELHGRLKGGKEATVYLAEGPSGLLAVKIYTDLRVRSFRNDRTYRDGRFVPDVRLQRAIDARSSTGLDARQALWIEEEYAQLATLHQAGLSVPKPVARAGAAILMEYIGDEDGPAPRLADVHLPRHDAEDAYRQSAEFLVRLLEIGRVHGDYSTYNLLWWHGRVVAIDFPQVVHVKENAHALALLKRDTRSLCGSFTRLGVHADPDDLERVARARAGL